MDVKKEYILDQAKKRFERFGVRKTTMDEIARDTGMSKKTLYEFFKGKDDLFTAVFIREVLAVRQTILKGLKPEDNVLVKLRGLLFTAADLFSNDAFFIRVLKDDGQLYAPFLQKRFQQVVEDGILAIIAGLLADGQAEGLIRDLDVRLTAYYIFKLFQAATYARTDSIKGDVRDLEGLLDLLLNGIKTPPVIS